MEDAFALFKSDIESRDLEFMVDAANKLTIVAASIGKARILSDIIPYLPKLMAVPSDEVLVAICRQFYNIWDLAGGLKAIGDEGLAVFFACLRQLGQEEEVIVRQAAILSFNKLLPLITPQHITNFLLPLFRHFASHDLFGARHTAAFIIPAVYRYSSPTERLEIKQALITLSMDETPMVRRVIAQILPPLCKAITDITTGQGYPLQVEGYELIKNVCIPIIQQLSLDERDYLRDLAPQCVTGLIASLPLIDYETYVFPIIKGLSEDLSWKVRQHVVQQSPLFLANILRRATYQYQKEASLLYKTQSEQIAFKQSITTAGGALDLNKYFAQIFTIHASLLLHDPNLEVRSVGILNLPDMVYLAKGIVPTDLFETQREPIFTSKIAEQDHLTLTLEFPSSPSPHKKKLFQKPAPSNTVFTIDHQNFLDNVGKGFPELARELGSMAKVDLSETFAAIGPFVGAEYITTHILPVISYLALDEHVQVRATTILSLEPILATISPDVIIAQLWPIIEALATDPRWRVRRAVSTQITPLAYYLRDHKEFLENEVLKMIEDLLVETVHAVRNRTAVEFRSLVYILGAETIGKRFLPLCQQLFDTKTNYLTRMTALHFLFFSSTAFEKSCPPSYISTNFTPYFLEALNDQVPNVKSQAIRYLVKLIKNSEIKDIWNKDFIKKNFILKFQNLIKTDTDREIIYQSTEALKILEQYVK